MRLVIADTSPLNYLILIGHIDILPALFGKVILPATVQRELASSKAPPSVQHWTANPPSWLYAAATFLSDTLDWLNPWHHETATELNENFQQTQPSHLYPHL